MKLNNHIRLAITTISFIFWAILMRLVYTNVDNMTLNILGFSIILVAYMFFTKLSELMWDGIDSFYATKEPYSNYNYAHKFAFSFLILGDFIFTVVNHAVNKEGMSVFSIAFGVFFAMFGLNMAISIYKARKKYLSEKIKL